MHNLYILSAILVVVSCVSCVEDGKNHPHFPSPEPSVPQTKEEKITESLNDTATPSEAVTSDTPKPHERDAQTPKQQGEVPFSTLENLIQEIQEEIQQFDAFA